MLDYAADDAGATGADEQTVQILYYSSSLFAAFHSGKHQTACKQELCDIYASLN